ncbi:MAG: helix-turn-helix domain-containing protein [Bacteroides sp.]|nr:helix-turn-helix domain-containing protein [Bacteroides sp.]
MITTLQRYALFFVITNDNSRKKMNEQQLFLKIGDKIKEIRTLKGISQQDLAAKCNFEKANMSRIEAGRTNLTLKNAYKISLALGVKLKELVDVE